MEVSREQADGFRQTPKSSENAMARKTVVK